jgi:RNA polymerase sigma-70 factor (ECF subfamily)
LLGSPSTAEPSAAITQHKEGATGDLQLIAGLAAGDQTALGDLYDRQGQAVYSILVRIVADREAAEELLQDVFLSAWRQADVYDARRGGVRQWLLGIAHNLALNELRRRRRRPQSSAPLAERGEDPLAGCVDPALEPPEAAWQDVRNAALTEMLGQLPASQRVIVELYAAGFSQSEIAARLGEPLGTVKSRMRRALCHLRHALPGCGVDGGWAVD